MRFLAKSRAAFLKRHVPKQSLLRSNWATLELKKSVSASVTSAQSMPYLRRHHLSPIILRPVIRIFRVFAVRIFRIFRVAAYSGRRPRSFSDPHVYGGGETIRIFRVFAWGCPNCQIRKIRPTGLIVTCFRRKGLELRWQVLSRGPYGDRIARACRHTGPDLTIRIGVTDGIAKLLSSQYLRGPSWGLFLSWNSCVHGFWGGISSTISKVLSAIQTQNGR